MSTHIALFFLALFGPATIFQFWLLVRALREERVARTLRQPPRPGLRFTISYAGSFGLVSAIGALIMIGILAASAEGAWRLVPLVLVNMIIQPLCILMLASGAHNLWHALRGRVTYAFRIIPAESIPPERQRDLMKYRMVQSIVGIVFASALGCSMLWVLLGAIP
jgi:hypothetical protein